MEQALEGLMRDPDTYRATRRNNSRWTLWTNAMYHEEHGIPLIKHRPVRYSGAERERDEAERVAKAERAKWEPLRRHLQEAAERSKA
jgi:hypothetical protein